MHPNANFPFKKRSQGVTAGAHRLWTHRSYKARLPLRIFLAFANAMATENSIYVWSRDHRVHHKYSETDADPHNANRGFFFAHVSLVQGNAESCKNAELYTFLRAPP